VTSEEAKKKYGYTDAGRVTVDGETLTSAGSILSARIFCDILNEQATEIERLKAESEQKDAVLKAAFEDSQKWGNEARRQLKDNDDLRRQLAESQEVLRLIIDRVKCTADYIGHDGQLIKRIRSLIPAKKDRGGETVGEKPVEHWLDEIMNCSLEPDKVQILVDHAKKAQREQASEIERLKAECGKRESEQIRLALSNGELRRQLDIERDTVKVLRSLIDSKKRMNDEWMGTFNRQKEEIERLKAENESKAIAMKDDLKKLNQLLSENVELRRKNVELRRQLAEAYERCIAEVKKFQTGDDYWTACRIEKAIRYFIPAQEDSNAGR